MYLIRFVKPCRDFAEGEVRSFLSKERVDHFVKIGVAEVLEEVPDAMTCTAENPTGGEVPATLLARLKREGNLPDGHPALTEASTPPALPSPPASPAPAPARTSANPGRLPQGNRNR